MAELGFRFEFQRKREREREFGNFEDEEEDSTTTVDDEEDEEEDSRVRSSSARWPEKERKERRKRGLGLMDQVEKAVMNPVGSNGLFSSFSRWERTSEVTRQRGLSWENELCRGLCNYQ